MKSVDTRLRRIEKRIGELGGRGEAVVKAHLLKGTFESRHIDQLFRRIYEPYRAAVLMLVANTVYRSPYVGVPLTVTGKLAMYLASPYIGFAHYVDPERAIAECEPVLRIPQTIRSNDYIVEVDNKHRALRGLAQRLVKHDGEEALRNTALEWRETPEEEWPVPAINRGGLKHLLDLVDPLKGGGEVIVCWRSEDNQLRWGPEN